MKSLLFFLAMFATIVAMFEEQGARNTDIGHFAVQWHHYAVVLGWTAAVCIGLMVIIAIIEWVARQCRLCQKQLAEISRLRSSLDHEQRRYKTLRFLEQR